ncbi:unnamed protein product [Prunus armeniaca]
MNRATPLYPSRPFSAATIAESRRNITKFCQFYPQLPGVRSGDSGYQFLRSSFGRFRLVIPAISGIGLDRQFGDFPIAKIYSTHSRVAGACGGVWTTLWQAFGS